MNDTETDEIAYNIAADLVAGGLTPASLGDARRAVRALFPDESEQFVDNVAEALGRMQS